MSNRGRAAGLFIGLLLAAVMAEGAADNYKLVKGTEEFYYGHISLVEIKSDGKDPMVLREGAASFLAGPTIRDVPSGGSAGSAPAGRLDSSLSAAAAEKSAVWARDWNPDVRIVVRAGLDIVYLSPRNEISIPQLRIDSSVAGGGPILGKDGHVRTDQGDSSGNSARYTSGTTYASGGSYGARGGSLGPGGSTSDGAATSGGSSSGGSLSGGGHIRH